MVICSHDLKHTLKINVELNCIFRYALSYHGYNMLLKLTYLTFFNTVDNMEYSLDVLAMVNGHQKSMFEWLTIL
jgi:hypothetical protein